MAMEKLNRDATGTVSDGAANTADGSQVSPFLHGSGFSKSRGNISNSSGVARVPGDLASAATAAPLISSSGRSGANSGALDVIEHGASVTTILPPLCLLGASGANKNQSNVLGASRFREDHGAGVLLDTDPLRRTEGYGDGALATQDDGPRSVLSQRAVPKANMRLFLEKLQRRRRRIACSSSCWKLIRARLLKVADPSGRIRYTDLRETLREAPKDTSSTDVNVWRELVEVARCYDCTGEPDNIIDVHELLRCALEVLPMLSGRQLLLLQVILILVWFALAPLVYCFAAGWSFLDAMYFAVMILSTVGHTGLMPESLGMRVFTIFYMISGLALMSWVAVTTIASVVVQYEAKMSNVVLSRDADILADDGQGVAPGGPGLEDLVDPVVEFTPSAAAAPPSKQAAGQSSDSHEQRRHRIRAIECLVVMAVLYGIGACLYYVSAADTQAPMTDAFYWAAAMCGSLGSCTLRLGGDDVSLGRALTLAFVLIVTPGYAFGLFELGVAYVEACSTKLVDSVQIRTMQQDVLLDMDSDGRGISKIEFLCAVLMSRDKASAKDLWKALYLFESLDQDGSGLLDQEKLSVLRRVFPEKSESEEQLKIASGCWPRRRGVSHAAAKEATLIAAPAASEQDGTCEDVEKALPGEEANYTGVSLESAPNRHVSVVGSTQGSQRETHLTGLSLESAPNRHLSVIGSAPGSRPRSPRLSPRDSPRKVLTEALEDARKQISEKTEALLAAASARQQLEQARQQLEHALLQAATERQALHGEVRLLRHVQGELQKRIEDDKRLLEEAEQRQSEAVQHAQEAEVRAQESDRRRREAEQSCFDAERRAQDAKQGRIDAEAKARQASTRTEEAERHEAELVQKLHDSENEWRLQMEAKTREMELRCSELDMQRQSEIRAALLELQSLTQKQHTLRTQVLRSHSPPPLSLLAPSAGKNSANSLRLQTGQQPWEVWELSSEWARDNAHQRAATQVPSRCSGLLSGKVKEQAAFLDKQVRELESRQLSVSDMTLSTTLPGEMTFSIAPPGRL